MVVVAMIGILVSMAVPTYRNMVDRARETVLKQNLFTIRDVIDQYYADKGKYPESLETLVVEGYLRGIPADPMTQAVDWTSVPAESDPDDPGAEPGVYDVKSSSTASSVTGTPYSEW
jgi:general secretion pathway protein G